MTVHLISTQWFLKAHLNLSSEEAMQSIRIHCVLVQIQSKWSMNLVIPNYKSLIFALSHLELMIIIITNRQF